MIPDTNAETTPESRIVRCLRLLADGAPRTFDPASSGVDPALLRDQGAREIAPGTWQLAGGLELLLPERIEAALDARHPALMIEVLDHVDSTNARLLDAVGGSTVHGHVCTAEWQTAGRGRRGRAWQSPFGRNLAVSIGWAPGGPPTPLAGVGAVPLVLGVAAAHAIERVSGVRPLLKWPNDLYLESPDPDARRDAPWAKLGGILVESRLVRGRPVLVCGIGINVHGLPTASAAVVDQPWVPLAARGAVSRNDLLIALVDASWTALGVFGTSGFEPFRAVWETLDLTRDRPLEGRRGQEIVRGLGAGIDTDGALRVRTADGLARLDSGEVSVRLVAQRAER